MMDILIGVSDAIGGGLRDFLTEKLPGDRVRGALLDVDDYWLDASYFERLQRLHWHHRFWHVWGVLESGLWRHYCRLYDFSIDPKWRPDDWNRHCKQIGYSPEANPFIIRVILRRPEYLADAELPAVYLDHPIVYEYRPPCRGLSAIKEEVGSLIRWAFGRTADDTGKPPSIGCALPRGTAGTLGGLLRCPVTNKRYLVGCAHVLGEVGNKVYSPGPFEGSGLREIGQVRHSVFPPPKIPGQICHPDHNPQATKLDVALAEIWGDPDSVRSLGWIPPVTSVRSTKVIARNDTVTIVGKESGRVQAHVGALSMWDEVDFEDGAFQGGPRCFGRLFELRPLGRQYVREDLVKDGDSGACVLSDFGSGYSWDGILMSSDGPQGYACFAEYVIDECQLCRSFPAGLSLIP